MLRDKLKHVPEKPGSYQMMDAHSNILYVGKAKNLKHRLTSYFTGSHDYKTQKLVQAISDFEYIITKTELEALILEIDLIKKHQPRYNILLTDDKSYPYIEITRERHPRLLVSRPLNKTGNYLFGPYPNVKAARETLRLLHKLYPLRKCHKLPKEPCLYYYMGQCLAPCIHKVTQETYQDIESNIAAFLKGKTSSIVRSLKDKMQSASETLAFEKAQEYKEMIAAIETTTSKQAVNLDDLKDRDIIAVTKDETYIAIEIFFIRNGKISTRDRTLIPYYLDQHQATLDYLIQFYQSYPIPKEILTNELPAIITLELLFNTTIKHPQRGAKKRLLELAIDNAKALLEEQNNRLETAHEKTYGALDTLADLLTIPPPYHIEAFDNSHLHGTYPVSSMVVFKNGRPSKQDYRKFKLKETQHSAGDTALMSEVLYRRYQRVLYESLPRPDLILVDGGMHQLNAAKSILNQLKLNIPLAGIVKDKAHKTHHLINEDHTEITLEPTSKVQHLLAYIQEEAHRFAIDYHKKLRDKGVYETILDNIDGVGVLTKQKLLKHFKTIANMTKANHETFKALKIPDKTITNIMSALKKNR